MNAFPPTCSKDEAARRLRTLASVSSRLLIPCPKAPSRQSFDVEEVAG